MALISELTTDDEAVLVRTNYDDDAEWQRAVDLVMQPRPGEGSHGDLVSSVTLVQDPAADEVGPQQLSDLFAQMGIGALIFLQVPDQPEGPFLTFYSDEPGNRFRCPADMVGEVEANLAIDNLDIEDYQEMFGSLKKDT